MEERNKWNKEGSGEKPSFFNLLEKGKQGWGGYHARIRGR